jgi:hypothetical protein
VKYVKCYRGYKDKKYMNPITKELIKAREIKQIQMESKEDLL